MLKTKSTHVYLDIRHFDKQHFTKRFPVISGTLRQFRHRHQQDLIPVRPAAHYMVGGVKTDIAAKTNIENLYAAAKLPQPVSTAQTASAATHSSKVLSSGRIAGQTPASPKTAGFGSR